MTVTSTDSFYLFRDDGLDGPFSPVQLRLMLDRGLIDRSDYCQPEDGGPTRTLRDLFDDPDTFSQVLSTPGRNRPLTDPTLDPFASGDVPLMGDTLPVQAGSRDCGAFALRDASPLSSRFAPSRQSHPARESDVILDATDVEDFNVDPPKTETLYHGHPSFLSYGRSLAIALIAAVAAAFLLPVGFTATASAAGLAFLIIVGVWADRSFADYIVTTRRVEIITGFLSRSSNEVKISDIRSINVVKSGFLGFLGIGTVEFASAGGDDVEVRFKNIFGTQRVKEIVRQLQDA